MMLVVILETDKLFMSIRNNGLDLMFYLFCNINARNSIVHCEVILVREILILPEEKSNV